MSRNPETQALGDRIFRGTLAATVAASALLHLYIEYTPEHEGHGPRVEIGDLNPFAEKVKTSRIISREPAGEPYVQSTTIDGSEPTADETEQITRITDVKSPYAREFAEDAVAREFSQEDAEAMLKTAITLKTHGWDSVSIEVQGLSSAEDDSTDGSAGLQTPSTKNIELADTRRDAVIDTIEKTKAANKLEDIAVVAVPGREGFLKDNQVHIIQGLADQFGYANAEALVKAYNDDRNQLPPTVAALFDILLDSQRGTIQTIVATRTIEGEPGSKPTEEEVCIVAIKTVTEHRTEVESFEATVPYALPIVIGGVTFGTIAAGGFLFMRNISEIRRNASTAGSRAGVGGGTGSGAGGVDGEPDDSEGDDEPLPADQAGPEPIEESEEPVEEPTEKPEKKKRRFLPWILAPIVLVGAGVVIKSCDDGPADKPHAPAAKPTDPCEGLPRKEVVVSNRDIYHYGGITKPAK